MKLIRYTLVLLLALTMVPFSSMADDWGDSETEMSDRQPNNDGDVDKLGMDESEEKPVAKPAAKKKQVKKARHKKRKVAKKKKKHKKRKKKNI